jgi:hypothetical protein
MKMELCSYGMNVAEVIATDNGCRRCLISVRMGSRTTRRMIETRTNKQAIRDGVTLWIVPRHPSPWISHMSS